MGFFLAQLNLLKLPKNRSKYVIISHGKNRGQISMIYKIAFWMHSTRRVYSKGLAVNLKVQKLYSIYIFYVDIFQYSWSTLEGRKYIYISCPHTANTRQRKIILNNRNFERGLSEK